MGDTTWYPRMIPGDWPLLVTGGGLVLCGKDGCEEPLSGSGPVGTLRRDTVAQFLIDLNLHLIHDHGEATP